VRNIKHRKAVFTSRERARPLASRPLFLLMTWTHILWEIFHST